MKNRNRQSALTLVEMTFVIAAVAALTVLGLPAIHALLNSFESSGGTRAMISAGMASARAIAAKEQNYAGIRFQNKYQSDGKGCQYMIFIVHDFDKTELANGFRAVEGLQPIKLPDSVGVMDLRYRTNSDPQYSGDNPIYGDNDIDEPKELSDTTTFSIIFSPSGKLVIHDVRVRNRDGKTGETNYTSKDDIFNTKLNVENQKIAMFYQDDYPSLGLGQERSRNSFIIYDRARLEKINPNSRWSDYLKNLPVVHTNPYTGTIIEK